MKPVIVCVREDFKIELTKEELEKICEDCYNQGYEDGRRSVPTMPTIQPSPSANPWVEPWWERITCASDTTQNTGKITITNAEREVNND